MIKQAFLFLILFAIASMIIAGSAYFGAFAAMTLNPQNCNNLSVGTLTISPDMLVALKAWNAANQNVNKVALDNCSEAVRKSETEFTVILGGC